nr:putative ribonuclease H-like domain-containing protein [Tanacetum cinerariifolium]
MILNTLDNLRKFKEKGDEGYFIGYSMSSKAFRVFNKRTRRVEENLHVEFLENKAIEKGAGLNWLFDIDSLTKSMNYVPVDTCTISTNLSGIKDATNQEVKKDVSSLRYIALPNWAHDALLEYSSMETLILTVSSPVPTAYFTDSQEPSSDTRLILKRVSNQEETPSLDNILSLINRFEDILGFTTNLDESNGVEADISNIETAITASLTPILRIHKDHPKSQIIGPLDTSIQTRNKFKEIFDALQDTRWVEAMQEELLQFKIQNVWTLVDCPKGVRPIGIKWVLKNKKDERGIVIRNKARLVAQGHTQEEGIDYDEVFAPVVRIEAIGLFLAYASFMGFTVYQMDVKSAFLYGTIDEEVYVMQPPRFQDPEFPAKVYKVEKAMYGLHQAPRAWYEGGWYFFSQVKYVGDILKKFGYSEVRSSNTPMDKKNPWGKDETGKDVDLHLYRSMIGSLMYLTTSRPDIMFAVYACASDYGGDTQDRKSTIGGCQFLGRRLISWQCKKQTIVATSTTEAEYVCKLFPLMGKLSTVSVFLGFGLTFAGTSKYWGVLRILMISLRLIPLSEHNFNFPSMVDFIEASPLRIVPLFDSMLVQQGEGSCTPTEPHHTPSPKAQQTSHTTYFSPPVPSVTTAPNPHVTSSKTTPIRQYTRRARIAQSSALPPVADEPASPLRDVSQGEAFLTDSGFIANQDKETIAKSSTLPHDSAPRVTSPSVVKGSIQQSINELTALCTSLQRQYSELAVKFKAQEIEITRLKVRVKLLEDREGGAAEGSGDDAPIKGRNLDEGEAAARRASDDIEEMANVLTSMDAVTILASGVAEVPTGSGSITTTGPPATKVPTGSDVAPTASPVFVTATVVTPYRRRKGKEVMIARDAEIARIHAEEELQIMIDGLERNNETIAKYLQEYHQFASELPISQQRKPSNKKQKRDYYMAVIRSNLGWKVKDFRGSKEEAERIKRKGLSLEQESAKKFKPSEEVTKEAKSPNKVPKEKIKEMMQLVPIEEVYVEALQVK